MPGAAESLDGFRTSVVTQNLGRAKSKAVGLAFFLSRDKKRSKADLPFATDGRIGKLKPGKRARRSERLVIPGSAAGGYWFVLACVDPGGTLKEAKEGNNCAASRKLRVRGADPLKVNFTQHTADANTSTDGSAPSTTATALPDGTSFQFELSTEDADQFTSLTLTPVSGFSPVPGNVTPIAAVLAGPGDTLLPDGGLMRILLPGGPPAGRLVAFAFDPDGSQFRLMPVRVTENEAVIEVSELGGYGIGLLKGDSPADMHVPLSPLHRLYQAFAVAQAPGSARASGAENLDQRVCDYYTSELEPQLETAARLAKTQEEVAPLFWETLGFLRAAQLHGSTENLDCTAGYLDLFQRILKRVFEERYKACNEAGGDPVKEALDLIAIARQGLLLGFSEDFSWLAADPIEKFAECAEIFYTVSYSGKYNTRTDGGWTSEGTNTASGVRFQLGLPERVQAPLQVPNPSVGFSGDCAGSLQSNNGGELRVRGRLVSLQKAVTRIVRGKLREEVETESKVRVEFQTRADVVYEIDCGGGPSPWDLAGDGGGAILMPTSGEAQSLTSDGFPTPGVGDQTCVECLKITHTVSLSGAARGG